MKYGEEIREAAREAYIMGLPCELIGKVHGVSGRSVRRWAKEGAWEKKRQNFLSTALGGKEGGVPGSNLMPRLLSYAGRLLDRLDELLALEEAMAPRDLKSMSSTMMDILSLEKLWRERQEKVNESGDDGAWTVNIINQDWGDEDAKH